MPQQAFGVITTSGLRNGRPDLASQQVKVLRRSAGVADLDIVFGAQLQEALQAGAGMFRPLAFEAVRQEQHQAAQALPLGFAAQQ